MEGTAHAPPSLHARRPRRLDGGGLPVPLVRPAARLRHRMAQRCLRFSPPHLRLSARPERSALDCHLSGSHLFRRPLRIHDGRLGLLRGVVGLRPRGRRTPPGDARPLHPRRRPHLRRLDGPRHPLPHRFANRRPRLVSLSRLRLFHPHAIHPFHWCDRDSARQPLLFPRPSGSRPLSLLLVADLRSGGSLRRLAGHRAPCVDRRSRVVRLRPYGRRGALFPPLFLP